MSEQLNLMSRDQVTAVLEPTENLSHVDVELGEQSKNIFFKADDGGRPVVTLSDGEHLMTSEGLFEAARSVGIPETYSSKCPSELLFHNLDFWYRGGGLQKGKLRFFVSDNVVVGVNANHPEYYNTSEMLEAIEQVIGPDHILGYHQVHSTLQQSRVSIVTDRTFEAISGDVIHGGIDLQNSIIGEFKIEVTPYLFRQFCSNGAIVSENISEWSHRNDGDTPIGPWTRNAASSALSGLNAELDRLVHLTQISVNGHVPDTLSSLFRRFMIPVRTQQEIVGEASSQNGGQGPQSMYDIWNAITRVATYSSKLNNNTRRNLQRTAGEVTREYNLCPSCHQLVSGSHSH